MPREELGGACPGEEFIVGSRDLHWQYVRSGQILTGNTIFIAFTISLWTPHTQEAMGLKTTGGEEVNRPSFRAHVCWVFQRLHLHDDGRFAANLRRADFDPLRLATH